VPSYNFYIDVDYRTKGRTGGMAHMRDVKEEIKVINQKSIFETVIKISLTTHWKFPFVNML